jgi:hypothetical protein
MEGRGQAGEKNDSKPGRSAPGWDAGQDGKSSRTNAIPAVVVGLAVPCVVVVFGFASAAQDETRKARGCLAVSAGLRAG